LLEAHTRKGRATPRLAEDRGSIFMFAPHRKERKPVRYKMLA